MKKSNKEKHFGDFTLFHSSKAGNLFAFENDAFENSKFVNKFYRIFEITAINILSIGKQGDSSSNYSAKNSRYSKEPNNCIEHRWIKNMCASII